MRRASAMRKLTLLLAVLEPFLEVSSSLLPPANTKVTSMSLDSVANPFIEDPNISNLQFG